MIIQKKIEKREIIKKGTLGSLGSKINVASGRAIWGLAISVGLWILSHSPTARANVVGVDTQNFNPITDGLDYVTVHSSKTLNPELLTSDYF